MLVIKNKQKYTLFIMFLWIFLILFMSIIYYMSSETAQESHRLSKGIVTTIKDYSNTSSINEKTEFIKAINFDFIIRKLAHFTEYSLLGIFMFFTLYSSKISIRYCIILTLTLCFLYSISDEIHQIFVSGRTPRIYDVLVDTLGTIFGILLTKSRCTKVYVMLSNALKF